MGLFGFGKKDNAPAPVATPVSAPAPGLVITGNPGVGKNPTAPASGGVQPSEAEWSYYSGEG